MLISRVYFLQQCQTSYEQKCETSYETEYEQQVSIKLENSLELCARLDFAFGREFLMKNQPRY